MKNMEKNNLPHPGLQPPILPPPPGLQRAPVPGLVFAPGMPPPIHAMPGWLPAGMPAVMPGWTQALGLGINTCASSLQQLASHMGNNIVSSTQTNLSTASPAVGTDDQFALLSEYRSGPQAVLQGPPAPGIGDTQDGDEYRPPNVLKQIPLPGEVDIKPILLQEPEPEPGNVYIDTAMDPTISHTIPIGTIRYTDGAANGASLMPDSEQTPQRQHKRPTARKSLTPEYERSPGYMNSSVGRGGGRKKRGRPRGAKSKAKVDKTKPRKPGPKSKDTDHPVMSSFKLIRIFMNSNNHLLTAKAKKQLASMDPTIKLKPVDEEKPKPPPEPVREQGNGDGPDQKTKKRGRKRKKKEVPNPIGEQLEAPPTRRARLKTTNYAELGDYSDNDALAYSSSSDEWEKGAGMEKFKQKTIGMRKKSNERSNERSSEKTPQPIRGFVPGRRGKKGRQTPPSDAPFSLATPDPSAPTYLAEEAANLPVLSARLMPNVNSSSFPCKITTNGSTKKKNKGKKKQEEPTRPPEPVIPVILKTIEENEQQKSVYQCPICPTAMESADEVRVHTATHQEIHLAMGDERLQKAVPYIFCRHCDYISLSQMALWNHFSSHHNIQGISGSYTKEDNDDKPIYKCDECSFTNTTLAEIEKHCIRKHGQKLLMFICSNCDRFRTFSTDNLVIHVKSHQVSPMFSCTASIVDNQGNEDQGMTSRKGGIVEAEDALVVPPPVPHTEDTLKDTSLSASAELIRMVNTETWDFPNVVAKPLGPRSSSQDSNKELHSSDSGQKAVRRGSNASVDSPSGTSVSTPPPSDVPDLNVNRRSGDGGKRRNTTATPTTTTTITTATSQNVTGTQGATQVQTQFTTPAINQTATLATTLVATEAAIQAATQVATQAVTQTAMTSNVQYTVPMTSQNTSIIQQPVMPQVIPQPQLQQMRPQHIRPRQTRPRQTRPRQMRPQLMGAQLIRQQLMRPQQVRQQLAAQARPRGRAPAIRHTPPILTQTYQNPVSSQTDAECIMGMATVPLDKGPPMQLVSKTQRWSEPMYQCLLCPAEMDDPNKVPTHMKNRHAHYVYAATLPSDSTCFLFCQNCDYVTQNHIAMSLHYFTHHKVRGVMGHFGIKKINEENQPKMPGDDDYVCLHCTFRHPVRSKMEEHSIKMHGTRFIAFRCVQCDFKNFRFGALVKHNRDCHGALPQFCTVTLLDRAKREDRNIRLAEIPAPNKLNVQFVQGISLPFVVASETLFGSDYHVTLERRRSQGSSSSTVTGRDVMSSPGSEKTPNTNANPNTNKPASKSQTISPGTTIYLDSDSDNDIELTAVTEPSSRRSLAKSPSTIPHSGKSSPSRAHARSNSRSPSRGSSQAAPSRPAQLSPQGVQRQGNQRPSGPSRPQARGRQSDVIVIGDDAPTRPRVQIIREYTQPASHPTSSQSTASLFMEVSED